jgi:SAM-dependent methyltransferase
MTHAHGHGNGRVPEPGTVSETEYWDARYASEDRIWSGNANDALVHEVSDMTPGTVLDLGCGEGGDAIWLALRGWWVTATDISQVALDRAAQHAGEQGVADRIVWQQHDLGVSFPPGEFDLVSAHFLHSRGDLPRERILRTAARAVAPGGVLLVVGHAGFPSWEPDPSTEVLFPTPDEVLTSLELPDGEWEVLISAEHERIQARPDGQPSVRTDNTLVVRRSTEDRALRTED